MQVWYFFNAHIFLGCAADFELSIKLLFPHVLWARVRIGWGWLGWSTSESVCVQRVDAVCPGRREILWTRFAGEHTRSEGDFVHWWVLHPSRFFSCTVRGKILITSRRLLILTCVSAFFLKLELCVIHKVRHIFFLKEVTAKVWIVKVPVPGKVWSENDEHEPRWPRPITLGHILPHFGVPQTKLCSLHELLRWDGKPATVVAPCMRSTLPDQGETTKGNTTKGCSSVSGTHFHKSVCAVSTTHICASLVTTRLYSSSTLTCWDHTNMLSWTFAWIQVSQVRGERKVTKMIQTPFSGYYITRHPLLCGAQVRLDTKQTNLRYLQRGIDI